MSSQKGGVNDLVCPDLSKAQDKNEFLFFAVLLNFFDFFQKNHGLYRISKDIPLSIDILPMRGF